MKYALRLPGSCAAVVLVGAVVSVAMLAAAPAPLDVEAAFKKFWDARSPQDAVRIVPDLVATGVTFDDALKRLEDGRTYQAQVPKGVVKASYAALNGLEYFYALNIPDSYDPARRYQVRIQLHGGVGRDTNGLRGGGTIGSLAGAEQIYILPSAWNDAPWWSDEQIENLRTILDTVKRTYNIDENRVAVAGVSDGGTGAYYVAMRDTTPFASFLPLNGHILVLRSVVEGDLFPNNLRNKPFFVVNGGNDPLYPTRIVGPYVDHMKNSGVALQYQPQPDGVHNTAWWPEVKDAFEGFVRAHPRNPLPDTLTWESGGSPLDSRAHWLIIDALAPKNRADARIEDVNRLDGGSQYMFDNSVRSGRVDLVRSGNVVKVTTRGVAEFTLLLSPDVFDFSKPVTVETNGQVAFEGTVTASVPTLLKWAAHDNDRTMLFGAELHVKVK